jgi:hypothetical protein
MQPMQAGFHSRSVAGHGNRPPEFAARGVFMLMRPEARIGEVTAGVARDPYHRASRPGYSNATPSGSLSTLSHRTKLRRNEGRFRLYGSNRSGCRRCVFKRSCDTLQQPGRKPVDPSGRDEMRGLRGSATSAPTSPRAGPRTAVAAGHGAP